MYSILKPDFLYEDVNPDITENDVDVVSDLWEMDGREVYRGSRDPRYTHANVYWLYDEDLKRVGCSEHDLADHGNFRVLWFYDSEFGTLLQEDGWVIANDIWSVLPQHAFDRAMNDGWTQPNSFLENCLYGPLRIVTVDMLIEPVTLYHCKKCNRRSTIPYKGCPDAESYYMDFPVRGKIYFVDEDMRIHLPPVTSSVWSRLLTRLPSHGGDSEQVPGQEQQTATPLQTEPSLPPAELPHRSPEGASEALQYGVLPTT